MKAAHQAKPEKIGHVLLDIEAIQQKMGWKCRETVYEWIKTRGFPKPLKGSSRCSRWLLSEVDSFIEQLPRSDIKQAA